MSEKPLIFNLHQPKVGGKTVESALERRLGAGVLRVSKAFPESSLTDVTRYTSDFAGQPELIGQGLKVITGHFFFGLHSISNRPFTYTTVIRHPLSRLVSYYNYVMDGTDEYFMKRFFIKNNMTFRDFVRLGDDLRIDDTPKEYSYIVDNGQCRLISGLPVSIEAQMSDTEYNTVMHNLETHFSLVAPIGKLSQFVVELFRLIGTPPASFLPRVNSARKDWVGPVDDATRRYIELRNRHDIALYDYAKERFAARHDKLTGRLAAQAISIGGQLYSVASSIRS